MARGRLVVLEGPDGAGKTTQVRRLVDWLRSRGGDVVSVREPGGTSLGDEIRRLLLDPASDIVPSAEALLYMASRAQLVTREIEPALARGAVAVIDRFFLATYAYQGAGRGLPEDDLRVANRLATNGIIPDLTILLSMSREEGLARAKARSGHDRMEQADAAFHDRVASAYESFTAPGWARAHPECGPIVLVDASGSEADVFARIVEALYSRWPESFPEKTS
jgi:dTMP kinase